MRAGPAGVRHARGSFSPAHDAALPGCSWRFRERRAASSTPSVARLRGVPSSGMASSMIPGETAGASIRHPGEAAEKRRLRRAASEARRARGARVVATRRPAEA